MSLLDPEPPPRHRVRTAMLVVAGLFVAWCVAVTVTLVRARSDAAAGLASISSAEHLTSPSDLLAGRPAVPLRDARREFSSAHRRFNGAVVAPLEVLPVVGRQIRSASALAGAAARIATVGSDVVGRAQRTLKQPHGTGAERIALLRALSGLAASTTDRLRGLRLGPSHALVSPLADKRAELVTKLAKLRTALANGEELTGGLATLLQGPSTYLVLAANNAEMRAGSGMFLSVGQLRLVDGNIALDDFRPAGDLAIAAPRTPPAIGDSDYAARWGWLNPNREWRNLAASPRFDATARLAASMWPSTGGKPVDGVVALDPKTLAGVLEATGPVAIGARTVGAGDVVDLLLHDQYVGQNNLDDAAQAGRREQLGGIAKASLGALQKGEWDFATLARGLADAAHGRHLMAWATAAGPEHMWETAGIAGQLRPDSLMLSVLNRGGNKLDHFLGVTARMTLSSKGAVDEAEVQVQLHNETPDGESAYVQGPYPGSGAAAGEYVGLLSLDLPAAASAVSTDGGPFAAFGADGEAQVAAVPVRVARGATTTVTFRFTVPRSLRGIRVEPTARLPAPTWSAPGQSWDDGAGRVVTTR